MSTDQTLTPDTSPKRKGAPRKPLTSVQAKPITQQNKFIERNSPDDNVTRGKISLYLALCILIPTVIYVCITAIVENNQRQAYQKMVREQAEQSKQSELEALPKVNGPSNNPTGSEYNKYADPTHKPNRKDIEDYTARKFSGEQRKDMRDALCAVYQTC